MSSTSKTQPDVSYGQSPMPNSDTDALMHAVSRVLEFRVRFEHRAPHHFLTHAWPSDLGTRAFPIWRHLLSAGFGRVLHRRLRAYGNLRRHHSVSLASRDAFRAPAKREPTFAVAMKLPLS